MPVPGNLTNPANTHIFRYSADLQTACVRLQQRIAAHHQAPPITNINTMQSPASYGGDPEVNENSRVAWLVGHGSPNDTRIGTRNFSGTPLDITTILQWLRDQGYTDVVDTCCTPDRRRTVNRLGLNYYCARDGQNVTENQDHDSLDDWWDHNGFDRR